LGWKNEVLGTFLAVSCHLRPYRDEPSASRPIRADKHRRGQRVLSWVTRREHCAAAGLFFWPPILTPLSGPTALGMRAQIFIFYSLPILYKDKESGKRKEGLPSRCSCGWHSHPLFSPLEALSLLYSQLALFGPQRASGPGARVPGWPRGPRRGWTPPKWPQA
jgi:hypothetical protein